MKKVLLINPRACSRRSMRLPLSVLALAAVLDGRYDCQILDGNADADAAGAARRVLAQGDVALIALMAAIGLSAGLRAAYPNVPIVWGGYFPTLYPDSALNAPYVNFLVRGQGEDALLELLALIVSGSGNDPSALRAVHGLSWKCGETIAHNTERHFRPPDQYPAYPYHKLADPAQYLKRTYMGTRTAVHQAAIGCRYSCSFCGVVSMYNGLTKLSAPARIAATMRHLRDAYGANAIQFYDNNFFDREDSSLPILEAMAAAPLPWWCYARADTLASFSAATWSLIAKSQLRMAYIGAEAGSDAALRAMHKGATVAHTVEVARRCREYGVIPEFSFVLGGPDDAEGEVENSLRFIRQLKAIHPEAEIILYFYSPTPRRDPRSATGDGLRLPMLKQYGPDGPELPVTPEEWTEPRWIDYVCHRDAPWLTDKLRQRIKDFSQVIGCRYPTVQDVRTPAWGKALLRAAAQWRYASERYDRPRELEWLRRVIPLKQPQAEGL
jgi:anaerobic magnesium-protoporphyrin IX monomethyl ester cyclase